LGLEGNNRQDAKACPELGEGLVLNHALSLPEDCRRGGEFILHQPENPADGWTHPASDNRRCGGRSSLLSPYFLMKA